MDNGSPFLSKLQTHSSERDKTRVAAAAIPETCPSADSEGDKDETERRLNKRYRPLVAFRTVIWVYRHSEYRTKVFSSFFLVARTAFAAVC